MDFTNKLVGGYRLLEHIGSGAYGRVYKARHRVLPRIAAVKLLTAGSDSQEKREAFLREAHYLETLRHRYILEVIDANIEEDGTPFIISRFATGGSLAERLRRAGGGLSAEMTLRILNEVGEALEHAHQQKVIHRDLKPGNILFDEAGNAVLSDFGIATTLADDHSLRHTAHVLGTPYYMAPEQIGSMICKEIDQYALGCVAYEMYTGRKVFDGQNHLEIYIKHTNEAPEPPSRYNSGLPAHIERAILRALAKQREDRYPSVAAFLRALNNQGAMLDDAPPTLDTLGFSSDRRLPAARPEPAPAPRVETQAAKKAPAPAPVPKPQAPQPVAQDRAFEPLTLASALETPQPQAQKKQPAKKAPVPTPAPVPKTPEPPLPAPLLVLFKDAWQKEKNPDAWIRYGRALYDVQRYSDAVEAFQKGTELASRNASYQRWLGLAYQKVKQYPAALAALEKATQIDPGQAGHFFALGELHEEMQNDEQAMIAFGEAVRLASNNGDYRRSLEKVRARFNERQARLQQASAPAAKKQPAQPQPKAAEPPAQAQAKPKSQPKAQVQPAQAQPKPKAQEARTPPAAPATKAQPAPASKSGVSLPDTAEKSFEQGMAFYSRENYSRALVAFDRAVQLAPQNTTYLCAQGRAYLKLGLHDDALATFNGAINIKPGHYEGYHWKAETLKAMGKPAEAAKVISAARSLGSVPRPAPPASAGQPNHARKPGNQEGLFQRIIKNLFS